MELQKSTYTEKRNQTLELPDENAMTAAEKLASRGMILYDKVTSIETAEVVETKKWDELAKKNKKQTKK
jgi:cyclopropane fatty-acyl-phospholipid synthase-like methyltransferase